MSEERATPSSDEQAPDEVQNQSVGTLELFFDLVFVYAMAQVTVLIMADVSWVGFGHGLLGLAAVWWAWVCYAWLTNTSAHAGPLPRVLIFLAMAAMLVAAVALPQAFGARALVFGLALVAVRLMHVVLLVLDVRGEAAVGAAALRLVPTLLTGPALVVAAAFLDSPARELLWIAAVVIDFSGPLLVGTDGWRVAPSYFVERHGLVVIIALGEAIVEVGAGAEENLARPGVLVGVVLAVLIAAGLWWSYFGYIRAGAERRLRGAEGQDRARLARDSYSYLHLPLVAGVVFFALGVHEAVAGVDEPLPLLPALALAGGVALFFAADVGYRWRDHHQLATDRVLAALAAAAVIPLAMFAPALAALATLTAVCVVQTGWELWRRPEIGPVGRSH
ncbi:low temperature requirement protein A [Pseudonocardia kujensis]|uniref:low temperature requirement protein A n=1 Tax=Pseudonocardia kujensis TaxID=1128675 RepID=UPI001E4E170F|nr:low temperature requirement protein A [Pseudonocardia kujensis]MCE0766999.1 low temperature requirement protein A [Pseudonocardia kujensis]